MQLADAPRLQSLVELSAVNVDDGYDMGALAARFVRATRNGLEDVASAIVALMI